MKMTLLRLGFLCLICSMVFTKIDAQVGINTNGMSPDSSAMLDISSTEKGMLIPRLSSLERNNISNPATGLMVYDSDEKGFWFFNGANWMSVNSGAILIDEDNDTKVTVDDGTDDDKIRMSISGDEKLNMDSSLLLIRTDMKAGFVNFASVASLSANFEPIGAFFVNSSTNPVWQSFTAAENGKLEFVQVIIGSSPISEYNIILYEDEGTSGTILGTSSLINPTPSNWNSIYFPEDNIILEKGKKYSVWFSSRRHIGHEKMDINTSGISSVNPGWDHCIRVYALEEEYGLNVVDGNIGIGTSTPISALEVNGAVTALSFNGDGSGLTNTGSDNQTIDVLNLNGTTLEISLQGDGEATQTLDLSSIDTNTDTDDQTIDFLNLNGSTLEISLQDDGVATQTLDLGSIDTDNQKIDVLELNGSILEISLQDDGEATKIVSLANLAPVGVIQMWPTPTPPDGWLICDGSTFSPATYPNLAFTLGGTVLPNFNGRFPLGVGNSGTTGSTAHGLNSIGGEEMHFLTIAEMPAHSHGITYADRSKDGNGNDVSDLSGTGQTTNSQSAGGSQAHNNMPPFYTIYFIIKAE